MVYNRILGKGFINKFFKKLSVYIVIYIFKMCFFNYIVYFVVLSYLVVKEIVIFRFYFGFDL